MLRVTLKVVMSIIWYLSVPLDSILGTGISRYQHLFSGATQTMQIFMWPADMRSIVLCVRECLSVLLDASIATTADSDPTSNQPLCGWDDVIFFHSFIPAAQTRSLRDTRQHNTCPLPLEFLRCLRRLKTGADTCPYFAELRTIKHQTILNSKVSLSLTLWA